MKLKISTIKSVSNIIIKKPIKDINNKDDIRFSPLLREPHPAMTLSNLREKNSVVVDKALRVFKKKGTWSGGLPSVDVPKLAREVNDPFRILYTPGVAAPSLLLAEAHINAKRKNSPKAWSTFFETLDQFTPIFRRVAVVTDSTRVLGMKDVGPYGGWMVMSGKILLFNLLGGLYGEPVMLTSTDPKDMVNFVLNGQASWGAINLEDIASPKCYEVLETLQKHAEIPVWHDDQQGTSEVVLAGILNSLKVTGKSIDKAKIVLLGFGAANTRTLDYLVQAGANPENIICVDSHGIINLKRTDIDWDCFPNKLHVAKRTKPKITGGISKALVGAGVLVGFSKPGSVTVKDISKMAPKATVFLCANPIPEADPLEVKNLPNVAIVGTGRSDYPNQVNNSLVFPGTLAGAMAVAAKDINDEMVVAGALALADSQPNPTTDEILPKMTMEGMVDLSPQIAKAVAKAAIKTKVNRLRRTPEQVYDIVRGNILEIQGKVKALSNAHLLS